MIDDRGFKEGVKVDGIEENISAQSTNSDTVRVFLCFHIGNRGKNVDCKEETATPTASWSFKSGPQGINNNLPLDKAEIIAFFLETLLYGVSAFLFAITSWVLIYRKKGCLNKQLIVISSSMAVFGTVHMAIDLSRILQGFIDNRVQPGGPVAYFAKLYLWSHIVKTAIFAIQTVLADSFATYRCWVVWGRSWAAILPAVFVIATSVTGVGIVHGCALLKDGENVFDSSLTGWITSFFSLTLATNIVCTSLIAVRIWYITKNVSRYSSGVTLMPVVIIIIESGAVYSLFCIVLLTAYILGSNAQYPALDGTFPIISIVFNLIIVRIALGIAHGGPSGMHSTQNPSALHGSGALSYNRHTFDNQCPLKPLTITLPQRVHKGAFQKETFANVRDSFVRDGELLCEGV